MEINIVQAPSASNRTIHAGTRTNDDFESACVLDSRNRCWGKKKFIPCLENMFHLRVKPRTGRRHSETRYQDSGIGNGLGEIPNAGGTV